MTAIAFAVFLASSFILWLDECLAMPESMLKAAGITAVLSFVTFVCGLFVWIWRVMP